MTSAILKTLDEHLRSEEQELRRLLAKRAPGAFEATMMLFQPHHCTGSADAGKLVDIGPRSREWPQGTVWQPATSGSTGKFLDSHEYARTFLPQTETITEDVVSDYRANIPGDVREAQVGLERLRYRGLSWSNEPVPPQGSYIHHISLSPPPPYLADVNLPSFGVVYSLSSEETSVALRKLLVPAALMAGALVLERRIKRLLGDMGAARQVFDSDASAPATDDTCLLLLRHLLNHHWFFPYDPLVSSLAILLGASEEEFLRPYELFGVCAPRFRSTEGGYEELVTRLEENLLTLAAYGHVNVPADRSRPGLRRALNTLLLVLFGQPASIGGQDNLCTWQSAFKRGRVTVLPREVPVADLRLQIPVFDWDQLRTKRSIEPDILRAYRRLPSKRTRAYASKGGMAPKGIVIELEGRTLRDFVRVQDLEKGDNERPSRLMTALTRAKLEGYVS